MNEYKGLTEIEAKKRIETYGLNEIKEEKKTVLVLIFQKFWGPIPWILELTIIITLLLKKYPDSIAIFILLVFNASVSFLYELSSFNALNLLKKHLSIKARVLRDGTWKEIDSKFLTVGDIVSLQKGFAVPADVKILDGTIMVDQSSITGYSIKRTTFKYRNPANKPDKYEEEALNYFEEAIKLGKMPPYYVQAIKEDNKIVYRYYKPLKVEGLCLTCHGDPSLMDPNLIKKIKTLYPTDMAMGYKEGDFRGVVRVSIPEDKLK